MTEAEWLACTYIWNLFNQARGRATERAHRLFLAACCRLLWRPSWDAGWKGGLDAAERFADGAAPPSEMEAVRRLIHYRHSESPGRVVEMLASEHLSPAAYTLIGRIVVKERGHSAAAWQAIEAAHTRLCREIVGNPFRPAAIAPDCRSAQVLALAQATYDERLLPLGHLDNARLAVLSDALEEAGCEDEDILTHLRSPGPHVRGWWALDLVLGRG